MVDKTKPTVIIPDITLKYSGKPVLDAIFSRLAQKYHIIVVRQLSPRSFGNVTCVDIEPGIDALRNYLISQPNDIVIWPACEGYPHTGGEVVFWVNAHNGHTNDFCITWNDFLRAQNIKTTKGEMAI